MVTYVPYLLIFLAAFFNACMDAFENENFFESIFKNWNQKVWYKRESWKHAKRVFSFKLDAWHMSKAFMIICMSMCFAIQIYIESVQPDFIDVAIRICYFGTIWNFTFWLFYHKIFMIK